MNDTGQEHWEGRRFRIAKKITRECNEDGTLQGFTRSSLRVIDIETRITMCECSNLDNAIKIANALNRP